MYMIFNHNHRLPFLVQVLGVGCHRCILKLQIWRALQRLLTLPLTQHIEEGCSEDEADGQEGQHWHHSRCPTCRTHIFFQPLVLPSLRPSLQTGAHRGSSGFTGVNELFVHKQYASWMGGLLGRLHGGWQVRLGRDSCDCRCPFCGLRNLAVRGR